MHPHMQASLGRSACMYAKRVLFQNRGFASSFSLESSRIHLCVMVSRSIVVHWDGAWSASHLCSAVLSAVVGQVRAGGPLSIAAPRQRALYPILPFSTLPCPALTYYAVLLYLCVCCVSLLCVSYLTYLSPFVSLSLCYCSGRGRPSIMQPVMAILLFVRSFSSRERTSPPGTR